MNRRRLLQEVRLRDFRCFHEKQTARLAPLTLLVGENSTGKTSFLAAIRAACEAAAERIEPDFRKPPYDLGPFAGIAHSRGGRGGSADSFEIGLSGGSPRRQIKFDATFESQAAVPTAVLMSWQTENVWIRHPIGGDEIILDFGSAKGSWRFTTEPIFDNIWAIFAYILPQIIHAMDETDESLGRFQKLAGSLGRPDQKDLENFSTLLDRFRRVFWGRQPFAGAPIRSSPRRTYDPTGQLRDPEGAYVPSYLASLHFRSQRKWGALKKKLEDFGRKSGLFDEIGVRQLGRTEGGPFQLQIRKFANNKKKGPRRNLIDVGYGVSQTLPVLAELFRPDGASIFLFQQPEVHLHPSAQAALGSLLCETAATGRQLIIETHSDFIINRVRMDIRDGTTALNPNDVSLLFFERSDLDVRIHSLGFDEQGNVLGAPHSYGQFFMDEMRRSVGL